jgi:PAS domain S-box-containing protein
VTRSPASDSELVPAAQTAGEEAARTIRRLERRLERERTARAEAERIAESGLRKLYAQQQRLQVLYALTQHAATDLSLPELLAHVLDEVRVHTEWPLAFFRLVPAVAPPALGLHWSGCGEHVLNVCTALTKHFSHVHAGSAPGWLSAEAASVLTEQYPELHHAHRAGLVTLVTAPLEADEVHLGEVGFFTSSPTVSDDALEVVRHAAALVGQTAARHAARYAVAQSEAHYRSVFDHAFDAIFVVRGGTGEFVRCNQAYLDLTGYAREELLRRTVFDVVGLTEADLREMGDSLRQRRHVHFGERHHLHRDGHGLPLEVTASHVEANGEELFVVVARDVSQRRRFEQGLIEARDRAESLVRLKNAFLRNMSHEFRTPLAGILGCAEVLIHEVDPELHEFVAMIDQSGRRLLHTLQGVLDLTDLENASDPSTRVHLDAGACVRDALVRHHAAARDKGLHLTFQGAARPLMVVTDRRLLELALDHLMSNAIRFTPKGAVQVVAEQADGEVRVSVVDTGPGIAEEFLPNAFDLFAQEHDGHSRTHEGVGIGLALVSRIVEVIGARITVRSSVETGSTFTLHLPVEAVQPESRLG